MSGDKNMHCNPERKPAPVRSSSFGIAVAIAVAAPLATAGILYGTDFRSYNGRSGHPVDSELEVTRTGFLGAYCAEPAEAGGRRMVYPLDVPDGFEIFGVTAWGEDNSAGNDLGLRLMESCQPFLEGGLPVTAPLATAQPAAATASSRCSCSPTNTWCRTPPAPIGWKRVLPRTTRPATAPTSR
jgi:hypothetical protein